VTVSEDLEAAVVDLPELVVRDVRAELANVVGELHDDIGHLMRQVVAGQDEISQLRAEVADLPGPLDGATDVRAEVQAEVQGATAELRADIEALVGELHDDLATVLRQIVAGQEEVEALREQLGAAGTIAPMAADLDRLSRDLQALRERIPGTTAAPAPRRRRSPSR
jgi:chromosome segregation ATPase